MRKSLLWLSVCMFFTLNPVSAQEELPLFDSHPYTYQQADGNRFVAGTGTFPAVREVVLREAGGTISLWILGTLDENGQPVWTISADDVPLFYSVYGFADLADRAELSPVTPYDDNLFYVDTLGKMIWMRDGETLGTDATYTMLDARPIFSDAGNMAIYTRPTQLYPHGVMGDAIEAGGLDVFHLEEGAFSQFVEYDLERVFNSGEYYVFEGLYPMWADVDGDGEQDLITTRSNARDGAQIVVVRIGGNEFSSPAIGAGNRWRHVLAFGAFGQNGENEIVEIQTPHIGGIVQFLRHNPATDALEVVAQRSGYTSHVYGSRNLDQAVAGDFNGDGQPEIVVTDQARTRLVGLQHMQDGVIEEVWSLPLDAPPTTNFSAVTLPDGHLGLAMGLADGSVRAWLPLESGD